MNTMSKSNLEKSLFHGTYPGNSSSLVYISGSRGLANLEEGNKAEAMEECSLLTCSLVHSQLTCLGNGTAYSGLGLPSSISNQENFPIDVTSQSY